MKIEKILTNGENRSPAEQLSNSSPQVRKTVSISERGHARSTDNRVQFFLAFSLLVWMSNHRQHEPNQCCCYLDLRGASDDTWCIGTSLRAVSVPPALEIYSWPSIRIWLETTYYIVPAKNASSKSLREWRCRSLISVPTKLGRSSPSFLKDRSENCA